METPLRVLLVGARGRMGQAITRAAEAQAQQFEIISAERGDDVQQLAGNCDVVVDFSHADAAEQICGACVANRKPVVIGTTGHSAAQSSKIDEAAKAVPIVLAANFSIGVNTLFWLTRKAAGLLRDGFDVEIVETHHRLKKDAPSGTAKRLAQLLCEARGLDYNRDVTHGREGLIGERPSEQVGVHAIRAGDVVGDHTIVFASVGERLELTHKASSRETFAVGALRAARWVIGKPVGLYSMEDVLGLTDAGE